MDEKQASFIKRRAKARYVAAKKKGGRTWDALDSYRNQVSQQFGFHCDLKPLEKQQPSDESFKSTLAQQYYARYVQAIGATPTSDTMKMVERAIPIKHWAAASAASAAERAAVERAAAERAAAAGGAAGDRRARGEAEGEPAAKVPRR